MRTWPAFRLVASALVVALAVGHVPAKGAPSARSDQGTADDPLRSRLVIDTTLGPFTVELNVEGAPSTALNFADYAEAGFYDGTIFHRVLKDGLIQGGAYTRRMALKTRGLREPVVNESGNGLHHERGTIAMFREINKPHSAVAQFFINVADNPNFDMQRDGFGYTVFGKIVDGMDVVDRIANTPVSTHPQYAAGFSAVVPEEPVVIQSVRLVSGFAWDRARALAKEAAAEARRLEELANLPGEERARMVAAEIEQETGLKFATTESGLMYLDLRVGSGWSPTTNDTVQLQYRGTLLDGTEIDSTYLDEPRVRAMSRLVPGIREGLQTMKEGGRRKLIIPPELAYGSRGQPGRVPPNAWLVFDIELLALE